MKNPPGNAQDMRLGVLFWSLRWEDPLEKGMATHFGIPAWRIPWTEEPGRLFSIGSQIEGYNRASACIRIHTHTHTECKAEEPWDSSPNPFNSQL